MPSGTKRTTRPSLVQVEHKQKEAITSGDPSAKIPRFTLPTVAIRMEPSKKSPTPQIQWSKEVHIWTPRTKFIPSNPACLRTSKPDLYMI